MSLPLQTCEDCQTSDENWSYRSLVCMLAYLARNARPNIEYIVYQCARVQCDPRRPHANTMIRIYRYLIYTSDKCLICKPTCDPSEFECYVDADFAGNYTKETCDDPNSVESRT